jgi:branched-chain amino acid transport system permease protein
LIQVIGNILISAALFMLIASSFSLVYFPAKFFHLAHAATISLGAYFTYLFTKELAIPLSIILAIVAASIIGILCELLIYKPMRKRNMPAPAYLIASIGLYTILQNCISLYFGDDTKVIRTGTVTIGRELFGAYITDVQILTVAVSLGLFIGVNFCLRYTQTGKAMRAVSCNPELCNIYGISSNKIILLAFAIGSALASVAGILSAMDTNMTPTFGFNLLLYGVVVMIIGGVGSTRGLIVSALLVATTQHLAGYYINTKWMDAVTYIILILFLIWKPLGFSGQRLKKVEL